MSPNGTVIQDWMMITRGLTRAPNTRIYTAILNSDDGHGFGVEILEFPGCFTYVEMGESWLDIIQEAVDLWMEGEDGPWPLTLNINQILDHPNRLGGKLMFVEIQLPIR